jgi:adenosylcobinamide kinase / adenosylcobinamide-phosphate guanylyltransferase
LTITLLLGGVRSGKSSLAVSIASASAAPVTFIATAQPFDDDMRARIAAHQSDRPAWPTVEAPVHLGAAIDGAGPDDTIVVDCLTVWVGTLFHHLPDRAERHRHYDRLLAALSARRASTIVVSNEVGWGIHPETELGRDYRDELGRLNQRVAAVATTTLLMVAGRALRLADPKDLL